MFMKIFFKYIPLNIVPVSREGLDISHGSNLSLIVRSSRKSCL